MTNVPIMLPAKLPDELDKPAIDRYGSENHEEYLIVFPFGPTETVTSVSNAEMLGTLRAYPKEEDVANEFFDAEKIEKTKLPDGTEATLRYMVPAGRTGSQGPFWEGKFDKKEYTYVLTVIKPYEITKDEVKQALSSMVLVRRSEGEPTTGGHPANHALDCPTAIHHVRFPGGHDLHRLQPKYRGDRNRGTRGGGGLLPSRRSGGLGLHLRSPGCRDPEHIHQGRVVQEDPVVRR